MNGPEFAPWFETFTPDGAAPKAGEMWRSPGHAETLRQIAETKAAAFYTGALAEKIVAFAQKTGGYLTADDLAAHTSTWVQPISTNYRGYDVWEIPPNGQGIAALVALNILEGFDIARLPRESVESYHLQLEAIKLAFADAATYVADPEHAEVPVEVAARQSVCGVTPQADRARCGTARRRVSRHRAARSTSARRTATA